MCGLLDVSVGFFLYIEQQRFLDHVFVFVVKHLASGARIKNLRFWLGCAWVGFRCKSKFAGQSLFSVFPNVRLNVLNELSRSVLQLTSPARTRSC